MGIQQSSARKARPSIVRLSDIDVGQIADGATDGVLVSLADAKQYLNLDHANDDAILTTQIHAAESYVESVLNRDLRARNYQAVFGTEDIPCPILQYTTGRPAATVSAVKMWDAANTETTLDGDGDDAVYAVRSDFGGELVVVLDRETQELYATGSEDGDYMIIEFASANATSANLVGYHAIKRAVMHLVSGGYEARESEIQGAMFAENPAVDRLLRPYCHKLNVRGI